MKYPKPIAQEIPVLKYFNGVKQMNNTNQLPYTHVSEELNNKVTEVMNEWDKFVAKAKSLGFDIRLAPNTKPLELYFHDDYPDMILVDKDVSYEREVKQMKAIDIDWDVDDEEDRKLLPTEINIPDGMEDEEEISDYLSKVTGFCHNGFYLVY